MWLQLYLLLTWQAFSHWRHKQNTHRAFLGGYVLTLLLMAFDCSITQLLNFSSSWGCGQLPSVAFPCALMDTFLLCMWNEPKGRESAFFLIPSFFLFIYFLSVGPKSLSHMSGVMWHNLTTKQDRHQQLLQLYIAVRPRKPIINSDTTINI